MSDSFAPGVLADIERVSGLASIKTVLRVLIRMTGMRIALVARVTPASWICCAALDEAGFGLGEGSTLDVSTTY